MNTYKNALQSGHQAQQTNRKSLLRTIAIAAIASVLAIGASVAVYAGNRPASVAENEYSSALEMQYARPWLEANKSVVLFSDALEMQYARPWLDKAQPSIVVTGDAQNTADCDSSLDMFYACQNGFGR